VKFNAAARYNGWTEADKCAHLKTSLTGAAAALLWQLEDASFGEIIDKLTAHYGSKEVLELKCYRRKISESLQEVAAELERLSALAYPGAMILMPDILAVDAFIEALDNTALKYKLQEREPSSLRDTLVTAMKLESLMLARDSAKDQVRRPLRAAKADVSSVQTSGQVGVSSPHLRRAAEETCQVRGIRES